MLVFDLETQHTLDEVGGRVHIRRLRMSVGVTYDPERGLYQAYTEEQAGDLIAALQAADRVVGYNLYGFDYEVLQAYARERLTFPPTVDMLVDLERTLGWRPKLDDVVAATLGERKSGDGLDAVRWFRQGRLDLVTEYCRRDVEVTWKLYDFGRRHRYVQVLDRRYSLLKVPVTW
ncbi:MAG: ribonuclease H-like domain-containing protein [Anaerolineae bacterium]|nr:ribonuclease H-like domain-containing protein [Anaerolineae bacterium]MDW8067760.1 ribonuclease H-like domain-containing protein [Anaerolineae bacterium]